MQPSLAHFIWLGPRLNALGYLSVRAALDRAGLAETVLHHDDAALPADPLVQDLVGRDGFRLRRLDPGTLFADTPPALRALYERLGPAPSRANLLRLLLLWHHGGLYLDTDAITLRDLSPLREEAGFAGLEYIAFPAALYASRNPLRWARASLLTTARALASHLAPDPGRAFGRMRHRFHLACNNAVLGAEPGHPFVRELLERAAAMDPQEAEKRFRLGPQLLEQATGNRSRPDFRLFDPAAFYPLPPEICVAYVRDDPARRLGDRPHPESFVAHLYDSVLKRRVGGPLDAAYFERTRRRTMLARMVEPYLDGLMQAARPSAGGS